MDPLNDGPCSSIQSVGSEEDELRPNVLGFSMSLDDSGTSGLGPVGSMKDSEDSEAESEHSKLDSDYSDTESSCSEVEYICNENQSGIADSLHNDPETVDHHQIEAASKIRKQELLINRLSVRLSRQKKKKDKLKAENSTLKAELNDIGEDFLGVLKAIKEGVSQDDLFSIFMMDQVRYWIYNH